MNINSKSITLNKIVEEKRFFSIPIYQRLFVWREEQVKTLLEDIVTAYYDKKELFYLGGVLVVENESLKDNTGKVYDLIDGQQRFTTLWMISIVLGRALKPFIERAETVQNRHRITFAIRDEVYHFFKEYIGGNINEEAPSQIVDALWLIRTFHDKCNEDKINLEELSEFIYNRVYMIFTEVPAKTDLNKLFEVINNRGIQLQHHEILKAKVLNKIGPTDRLKYSYLWDACAIMNSFVERNLKDLANIRIQDLFENKEGKEDLADPGKILENITESEEYDYGPQQLIDILKTKKSLPDSNRNSSEKDKEEYESDDNIRSIISFPMLLQHTLRLFLFKENKDDVPGILDKKLLSIFSQKFFTEKRDSRQTKKFIELLWKVRYYFDKHVIKWIPTEEGDTHIICKIEKYKSDDNNYLRRSRPEANEGVALLQSMLYHSQEITTQYWLTPYLAYLVENKGIRHDEYLKHLDNYLFCSLDKGKLIDRTKEFLKEPWRKPRINTEILNQNLGTSFPQYWFYKLEYILWEKYKKDKKTVYEKFKITAKNSVEHISPQNPQDRDTNKVTAKMLNSFGNLALVSRSINSEYSNLPYNEKRQRFINKNKIKVDSLKMDLIYQNESWNDDLAKKHQQEMIDIINKYIGIIP